MCTSLTSRDFYIVHHEMGHIQHYLQYKSLPFWFRRSPHGAFGEAIGDAIALATMSPTHLRRVGLLENYTSSRGLINSSFVDGNSDHFVCFDRRNIEFSGFTKFKSIVFTTICLRIGYLALVSL